MCDPGGSKKPSDGTFQNKLRKRSLSRHNTDNSEQEHVDYEKPERTGNKCGTRAEDRNPPRRISEMVEACERVALLAWVECPGTKRAGSYF